MKFLIPSYHRADGQKTLDYLSKLGYGRTEIVISTQTQEDYRLYSEKFSSKATILYRKATNCPGNRNTLLGTLRIGERAVMIDDDVMRLDKLLCIADKKHPYGSFRALNKRASLDAEIAAGFAECDRVGAKTFGAYPVHNERAMYGNLCRGAKYSYDRLFIGCFMAIEFTGQFFDEQYDTKEDYAYILTQLRQGLPIVRANSISPYASHFTKGGCHEAWNSEKNLAAAIRLVDQFPEYVQHNRKKPGEIKRIIKPKGGEQP